MSEEARELREEAENARRNGDPDLAEDFAAEADEREIEAFEESRLSRVRREMASGMPVEQALRTVLYPDEARLETLQQEVEGWRRGNPPNHLAAKQVQLRVDVLAAGIERVRRDVHRFESEQ